MTENQQAESYYNNIITNRNSLAHGGELNMTLGEVEQSYLKGYVILDYFRETLHSRP